MKSVEYVTKTLTRFSFYLRAKFNLVVYYRAVEESKTTFLVIESEHSNRSTIGENPMNITGACSRRTCTFEDDLFAADAS